MSGGLIYQNYSTQDEVIFKSHSLDQAHTFQLEHPFEEVYLTTPENTQINALWFKQNHPKGVILYFHGRSRNLNHWSERAYPFIEKGYDVLMIDYRGFGKSSAGFKESWFLEDGETAYTFLLNHYPEKNIIVYGHSMGTSIATWVASINHPKMLILEAPFYNMIEAASYAKPFIPEFIIRWILKYHLRTDQWIANVTCPIYIFHGVPDDIVPCSHSQKLFDKIRNSNQNEMITLPNAGHSNIPSDPQYQKKLDSLLLN